MLAISARSAVDDSPDLPLRMGGRAKAALAQLAGNLRKDLAVRPALGLQRQVAPADEVVDGFIEERDDFVDHGLRQAGRHQQVRDDREDTAGKPVLPC